MQSSHILFLLFGGPALTAGVREGSITCVQSAPHTGLVKKSTNMLTPVLLLLSQGTGMRFQHYSNGVG